MWQRAGSNASGLNVFTDSSDRVRDKILSEVSVNDFWTDGQKQHCLVVRLSESVSVATRTRIYESIPNEEMDTNTLFTVI